MLTPLRIDIELLDHKLHVSLAMSEEENVFALIACPELPRVLNDAMSNIRRHYGAQKIPTRGEAAAMKMREIGARLMNRIADDSRAKLLAVKVRAFYQEQTINVVTRSIEC